VSAALAKGVPGWSAAVLKFSRQNTRPSRSPIAAVRVRVFTAVCHMAPVTVLPRLPRLHGWAAVVESGAMQVEVGVPSFAAAGCAARGSAARVSAPSGSVRLPATSPVIEVNGAPVAARASWSLVVHSQISADLEHVRDLRRPGADAVLHPVVVGVHPDGQVIEEVGEIHPPTNPDRRDRGAHSALSHEHSEVHQLLEGAPRGWSGDPEAFGKGDLVLHALSGNKSAASMCGGDRHRLAG
jgi:hypothetical protein